MKLSIITINYNNAEGLRKTLASVAAQTYANIEHIIVDGASTDGSVEVIREYVKASPKSSPEGKDLHDADNNSLPSLQGRGGERLIVWTSEPDNGIYNAMNKGIKKATGDYVWILNSGDCVATPDSVECMLSALENNDISILLGNIVRVLPGNKKMYSPLPIKPSKDLIPRPIETSMLTFYTGTIPQDAAFIKRELFNMYGNFDDQLKIVSDWKLYLNMIALGDVVPMYVNIDVVLFDMTGISNTNMECLKKEKRTYLEEILPTSVLKDYDAYAFPISQYKRLKKYHLWPIVYFIERVLFKFEKWGMLR